MIKHNRLIISFVINPQVSKVVGMPADFIREFKKETGKLSRNFQKTITE